MANEEKKGLIDCSSHSYTQILNHTNANLERIWSVHDVMRREELGLKKSSVYATLIAVHRHLR